MSFKRDRDILVKRELLCNFYIAIGHPDNCQRSITFGWLNERRSLLQEVLEESEGEAEIP